MSDDPQARQGLVVEADDPVVLRKAIDLAFDYRGDVTLDCRGREGPVEGYIFDRRESVLRIIPSDGGQRLRIPYADIRRLTFSGRDTAAGKSFETWVRKYVRKKLAGEDASEF